MLDTVSASFIRSLSTSLGLPCLGDRRRLRTAPSASTLTTDVFAELVSFPDLLSHPALKSLTKPTSFSLPGEPA